MKKELLKSILVVGSAATLLTGCASMNSGYSSANGPVSALRFTTVTDPNQVIKWTGDRYLLLSMRGQDTYYFQVPETTYRTGESVAVGNNEMTVDRGTGATTYREGAGAAPGPYQSETRSYRVIRYRPGMSR